MSLLRSARKREFCTTTPPDTGALAGRTRNADPRMYPDDALRMGTEPVFLAVGRRQARHDGRSVSAALEILDTRRAHFSCRPGGLQLPTAF